MISLPTSARHYVRPAMWRCLLPAAGLLLAACGPGVVPSNTQTALASHFVSASAVFDVDRGELVLLGLVETPHGPVDETWVWNGRWSQLHPLHSPEPPRSALLMEDPADHAVLLYGGSYTHPPSFGAPCIGGGPCETSGVAYPTQQYSDMWSWNGDDWHQVMLATPPRGAASAYTYLLSNHELLMSFEGNPLTDSGTYRWDETAWTRISGGTFPEGTVAVDAGSGALLSYNGRRHGCAPDPCWTDVSLTEISVGDSWIPVSGRAPEPAAGNVVTDPTDGGVLMLNELGHTWVWAKGRWHEAATQGPSPSSNGFLYSDGTRVWYQTEPDYPNERWQWDGHVWRAA